MSTPITFGGTVYAIPSETDQRDWGASLSAYLIAISTGTIQRSGGTFTLTANLDFGSSFGLKAILIGTTTNDSAAAGRVGEYFSASPGGDVTPAASGSFKTITSVSLTAGDWEVEGYAAVLSGTMSAWNRWACAISTTTNAADSTTQGGYNQETFPSGSANSNYMNVGSRRISLAGSQSVFLVGMLEATLGTAAFKSLSFIRARRAR